MADSCIFVPKALGEPSKMYLDLLDSKNIKVPKALVNYYYSLYKSSDAPQKMDAAGFRRNAQDEHSAADVYKYFGIRQVLDEQSTVESVVAANFGIIQGNSPVNFSSKDAFQKASKINSTSKGWVARVIQRDDAFQVVIDKLDSRTNTQRAEVDEQLAAWQVLENGLRSIGVDAQALSDKYPALVSPLSTKSFISYMRFLANGKAANFNRSDIGLLLALNPNHAATQAINSRGWGTEREVVNKIYDILNNPSSYASSLVTFVTNSLNTLKTAHLGILHQIESDINAQTNTVLSNHQEVKVADELSKLDKKYGINPTVIERKTREIKKLSEAGAEGIVILERQIRNLQKQSGRTAQGIELEKLRDQLAAEVHAKRTYVGMLNVLGKASTYAKKIETALANVSLSGNGLNRAFEISSAVSKAKNYLDSYYLLVGSLANIESLAIDETITSDDIQLIKEQATSLLDTMNQFKRVVKDLAQQATIDTASEILGDTSINGEPIANIVAMGSADSTLFDFLYSCERVSDPMVAVMGTVIRDAQRDRDASLRDISRRIRESRRKLRNAGYKNEDFMYDRVEETVVDWDAYNAEKKRVEKELKKQGFKGVALNAELNNWVMANTDKIGKRRIPNDSWKDTRVRYYVVSEYNWADFNKDRNTAINSFRRAGLEGFQLQDAIDNWESNNMVDRVVDVKTGRTEKVPSNIYLKGDFQNGWSDAQKEYYNEMMQLKGEIGSLLPQYAQKQYIPPQRRASWTAIVRRGIEGKMSAKEVARNLLNRANPIKIQEDDTRYAQNGIISGEYQEAYSSYDDTMLKQIPIFDINFLRDQNDLTFNFDEAMQALAATAVNYDSMNQIKDLVDTMADVLLDRPISDTLDGSNVPAVDMIGSGKVRIAKFVKKFSRATRTEDLVTGMIEKHLYNEQLAKGQTKPFWRTVQALINYTSINNLAPNLKGAFSNYLVGEAQMLIESGAGEYYNVKDYVKAHRIMFGNGVGKSNVMDHITDDVTSMGHLLEERFDPLQDVYSELGGKRYFTGFEKLFGGFNVMGLYSAGESLIHLVNMYAVLNHEKVLFNGKEVPLYEAFDKKISNGNAELVIKPGYTTVDGNAIDESFLNTVQNKIRAVNQKTHGSMNTEDKGLIHRHMVGRSVLNFRQWMVEHYSRRYRGRYFDGTTKTWQEGYWNTVGKLAATLLNKLPIVNIKSAIAWDELDTAQRANVRRAISEVFLYALLIGLSHGLGDPKEHKGDYWYRFMIYQVRRLLLDEAASMPWGIPREGVALIKNPIAAVNTVEGFMYPIIGLTNGDIAKEYEKGPHKRENKYKVKLMKNVVPFYKQIDQLVRMGEEDDTFKIFENITFR